LFLDGVVVTVVLMTYISDMFESSRAIVCNRLGLPFLSEELYDLLNVCPSLFNVSGSALVAAKVRLSTSDNGENQ
jgi:hypothetical protein